MQPLEIHAVVSPVTAIGDKINALIAFYIDSLYAKSFAVLIDAGTVKGQQNTRTGDAFFVQKP